MSKRQVQKKANGAHQSSQGNRPQQPKKKANKANPPKQQRPPPSRGVAAAYATAQLGRAPIIRQDSKSSRVVHRELILSVVGTVNFTVAHSFSLNPGLFDTFPWLSTIASSWEEYKFHSLRFCYATRTGTNVPGSVMLAPDYDAADDAPSSEQIASSYSGSIEDAPWKDICCVLPKAKLQGTMGRHFVRSQPLAVDLDIKTYDVGTLHLITTDGTAVPWGKLWVEYDVEFTIPQIPPNGPASQGGELLSGGSGIGVDNPLGTAPVWQGNQAGVTASNDSIISFSVPGDYVVTATFAGTGFTAIILPTGGGNMFVINGNHVLTATAAMVSVNCRVTALPAVLNFSVCLDGTTVTSTEVQIGRAPGQSLS